MKIGDLSTDAFTYRQQRAHGFLQKRLISNELIHPAAEDIAAALADAQAQVLQQAADLVLEVALDLHQQGPTVQRRSDLMT